MDAGDVVTTVAVTPFAVSEVPSTLFTSGLLIASLTLLTLWLAIAYGPGFATTTLRLVFAVSARRCKGDDEGGEETAVTTTLSCG